MISDQRIIDWKNRMRDVMFSELEDNGQLAGIVLMARVNNNQLQHHQFSIHELDESQTRIVIHNAIKSLRPEAFVVIMESDAVLRPVEELQDQVDELKEKGELSKLRHAKRVAVFMYETRMISELELYEIVSAGDKAIINREPLLKASDLTENAFFMGMLNFNRKMKLQSTLN